ncbi:MAG: hypothetical protein ABR525_08940 [Candidatus Limnocylindria bacterium]
MSVTHRAAGGRGQLRARMPDVRIGWIESHHRRGDASFRMVAACAPVPAPTSIHLPEAGKESQPTNDLATARLQRPM